MPLQEAGARLQRAAIANRASRIGEAGGEQWGASSWSMQREGQRSWQGEHAGLFGKA